MCWYRKMTNRSENWCLPRRERAERERYRGEDKKTQTGLATSSMVNFSYLDYGLLVVIDDQRLRSSRLDEPVLVRRANRMQSIQCVQVKDEEGPNRETQNEI